MYHYYYDHYNKHNVIIMCIYIYIYIYILCIHMYHSTATYYAHFDYNIATPLPATWKCLVRNIKLANRTCQAWHVLSLSLISL